MLGYARNTKENNEIKSNGILITTFCQTSSSGSDDPADDYDREKNPKPYRKNKIIRFTLTWISRSMLDAEKHVTHTFLTFYVCFTMILFAWHQMLRMKKSLLKWEKHLIKNKWKSVISPRTSGFRNIEADCDIAWWLKFVSACLILFKGGDLWHSIPSSRHEATHNVDEILEKFRLPKAASENMICFSMIKKGSRAV